MAYVYGVGIVLRTPYEYENIHHVLSALRRISNCSDNNMAPSCSERKTGIRLASAAVITGKIMQAPDTLGGQKRETKEQ
jgi:hypothetical protein